LSDDDAWPEYLTAARQLDAVRRVDDWTHPPGDPIRMAREELGRLRSRLAVQRLRLGQLGVPDADLRPTEAELSAVARPMAHGPDAVLSALRQARATVEAAEADLGGGGLRFRLAAAGLHGALWLFLPLALTVFTVLACLGVAALTLPR
jgi:hypothetical protein